MNLIGWDAVQGVAAIGAVAVTGGGLFLVWRQVRRASETQTIGVILPIYERWRSDYSDIRVRLYKGKLDFETISDEDGKVLRAYLGYVELICILVLSGHAQFEVADKVWPTAFRSTYKAAQPYISRRRENQPVYAKFLQQFVEMQERKGIARVTNAASLLESAAEDHP